jgi:hypothetical protein
MGQLRCLVVAAHPLGFSLRLPPAGVPSGRSPLLKTDGRQLGYILAILFLGLISKNSSQSGFSLQE